MIISDLLGYIDGTVTLYIYTQDFDYNEDKKRSSDKAAPDFVLSPIGGWDIVDYIQSHLVTSTVQQFYIRGNDILFVLLKVDENTCNA